MKTIKPDVPYNGAFFRLYENTFFVLRDEFGEKSTLKILSRVLAKGLGEAYDAMNFTPGDPKEFKRVLSERDKAVGLVVAFPEVTNTKIVYQFHTDPFPGLRGQLEYADLDATYIPFKIKYVLGDNWEYVTTKHLWRGDPHTEHIIRKK